MQPTVAIACRGSKGELLGELTISDRRGRDTLVFTNGEISVSELGEYIVRFDGPAAGSLHFAPPVEPVLTGGQGEIIGFLDQPPTLGVIRLDIAGADGNSVWRKHLIVRPEKLQDLSDFEAMVDDLCRWRTSLALDLRAHVSARWRWSESAHSLSNEERLIILRAALEDNHLFENLAIIERSSLARLDRNSEVVRLGREEIDASRLGRYINGPGTRLVVPQGHILSARIASLPMWLPPARKVESVDTPENQFVKAAIRHFREMLARCVHELAYYSDSPILIWAQRTERKLSSFLSSPFFSKVSWPANLSLGSPALQRRDGYRGVLQAFLNLRQGFAVHWEELGRSVFAETRDVPTVYEFWCLLTLRAALQEEFGAELDQDNFLTESGRVNVKRGSASRSRTAIQLNGKPYALTLHFNRTFSPLACGTEGQFRTHSNGIGTWSKPMKPDFCISLHPEDLTESQAALSGSLCFVHLDSKYKLRKIGAGVISHVPDDLDKMHAYVASINHSKGAYVLFPGKVTQLYAAPPGSLASVGAIPLAPGQSHALGAALRLVLAKATSS